MARNARGCSRGGGSGLSTSRGGRIRGRAPSGSAQGGSPVLPKLLDLFYEGEDFEAVTADGADDTCRCLTSVIDRQAIPIIPICKNGRPRKEDCPAAIVRMARWQRECQSAFKTDPA